MRQLFPPSPRTLRTSLVRRMPQTSTKQQTPLGKSFWIYEPTQFISMVGNWAQMIAANVAIYGMTHSLWSLLTGVLLAFVPRTPAALWGGRLADKHPRRTVLLCTLGLLGMLALVLFVLQGMNHLSIWELYLMIVLNSAVTGIVDPTEPAFVQEMVPGSAFQKARYINSLVTNGAGILGGTLGGLLAGPESREWLFLLNCLSYWPALVFLLWTRFGREQPVAGKDKASLKDAWVYIVGSQKAGIRGKRDAKTALTVYAIVTIAFCNGNLMQPLIGYNLLGGAHAYAELLTANSIGGVAASLLLAVLSRNSSTTRRLLFSWSMMYMALGILYGASSRLLLSMMFLAMACFGGNRVGVSSQVLIVQDAPDEMRGRLNGIYSLVNMGGAVLSTLLAGGTVAIAGVRTAAIGGPALGLLGVTVYLVITGLLKRNKQ